MLCCTSKFLEWNWLHHSSFLNSIRNPGTQEDIYESFDAHWEHISIFDVWVRTWMICIVRYKNDSHALFAHTYKTHKFKGIGVKLNINFSGFISHSYLILMQGYQNDKWANCTILHNDNQINDIEIANNYSS